MLKIAAHVLDALRGQASIAHPQECCGLMLGEGLGAEERVTAISPARNIHPTPQTHFEIDPQALVDAHRAARSGGPQIIGYYHSHPKGPARPSVTDAEMAAGDGRVWAIVGETGDIAFWQDGELGFVALSYAVSDG